MSDIVLVKSLPDELVQDISPYVCCLSGASLLSDYVSTALAAGLRGLSILRIVRGSSWRKCSRLKSWPRPKDARVAAQPCQQHR